MRPSHILVSILIPGLLLVACGEGTSGGGGIGGGSAGGTWGGPGSGAGGGNNGGGGGSATLTFAGPTDASPTAIDEVAVTWDPAVLTATTGEDIIYDVFQADNVFMTGELLVGTTAPGVSSFLHQGLANGQSYFYRVLARTTESGLVEEPMVIVSAHLPQQPTGTPIDYAADVAPLWSRVGSDGVTTCLDCHDGSFAKPDFRTWEGVMIGMGTSAAPDSFVTPGMGEASWRDLMARVRSHRGALASHRMWESQIADFEAGLVPWIDEGATEVGDTTPPEFNAGDLADASKYAVDTASGTRLAMKFPHANDPESTPYGPQSFDHLRYFIFAGETSNTIDWEAPFRSIARSTFPTSDESFQILFDWPADTGVFVIRAIDWFGNLSIAEVELTFERIAAN